VRKARAKTGMSVSIGSLLGKVTMKKSIRASVVVTGIIGSSKRDREKIRKYKRKKKGEWSPPVVLTTKSMTSVNMTDSISRDLLRIIHFRTTKRIMNRRAII